MATPTLSSDPPAASASVLLGFRADNVRSFRDGLEFSFLATTLAEAGIPRTVSWRAGGNPISVLPVAGFFGANASGKSNVLRAMSDMRMLVMSSFRSARPTGGVTRRPYLLDDDSATAPSRFEIDLVLDGVRHEYGFVVDSQRVLEEWALHYPRGRAVTLFERVGDDVKLGSSDRSKGRAVIDLLRPNALFVSTAAAANHPSLLPIYRWFERNLWLAEAHSRQPRQALTASMLQDEQQRDHVLAYLRAADLGISGASIKEVDPEVRERFEQGLRIIIGDEFEDDVSVEALSDLASLGVQLEHRAGSRSIELHADDESLGTLVWFGLVGPVITALTSGSVLLADELDASLHPTLVWQLVQLFQDPGTNPNRAQLIFNSHDTTLLGDSSQRPLGRDQIWFTEKLHDGPTRIYPFTELDPRKDEAIGRRYLAGRYGAIPIIAEPEFQWLADELAPSGGGDG